MSGEDLGRAVVLVETPGRQIFEEARRCRLRCADPLMLMVDGGRAGFVALSTHVRNLPHARLSLVFQASCLSIQSPPARNL